MAITKAGFAAFATLLMLGQTLETVPGASPLLGPWLQFGAIGLLGLVLYWILVKLQPRERQEVREHTERVIDKVCSQFRAAQTEQHEDNLRIKEAIRDMAANYAAHLQALRKLKAEGKG